MLVATRRSILAGGTLAAIHGGVSAAPAGLRSPTLLDFLGIQEFGAVRFSPTGEAIAIEVKRGLGREVQTLDADRQDLYVYDVARQRMRRLTDGASKAAASWSPIWSPDGAKLAFLVAEGGEITARVWDRTSNRIASFPRNIDVACNFGRTLSQVEARDWAAWVTPELLLVSLLASAETADDQRIGAPGGPELSFGRRWERAATLGGGATVWDSENLHPCGDTNELVLLTADLQLVRSVTSGASRAATLAPDRKSAAVVVAIGPPSPSQPDLASPLENTRLDVNLRTELRIVDLSGAGLPTKTVAFDRLNYWSPRRLPMWGVDGDLVVAPVQTEAGDGVWCVDVRAQTAPRFVAATSPLDAELVAHQLALTGAVSRRLADGRPPETALDYFNRVPGQVVRLPEGRLAIADRGQIEIQDASGVTEAIKSVAGRILAPPPNHDEATCIFVDDGPGGVTRFRQADGSLRSDRIRKPQRGAALVGASGSGDQMMFIDDLGSRMWLSPGKSNPILTINEHCRGLRPPVQKVLEYRSGGETRQARLWLPPDYEAGRRYPAIVMGYPGTIVTGTVRNPFVSHYGFERVLMPEHGYIVIEPTLSWTPAAQAEHILGDLVGKVHAALDATIAAGFVDADRVGFYGHSNGGYLALALEARSKRFRALAAAAPYADLTDSYDSVFPLEANRSCMLSVVRSRGAVIHDGPFSPFKMNGSPTDVLGRYIANSPYFNLQAAQTPLLMAVGEFDSPAHEARKVTIALERRGVPVTLLQYAREGHILQIRGNVLDFWERRLAWFERYVRPNRQ